MAMMHTSPQGYSVIRSFEGRSLKAYRDEVGVWTIGYGNTNSDKDVLGFEVKAGVMITEAQCEQLLHAAMERRYEPSVRSHMGPDVTQPAFDAGGSFHYNTGAIARASWVKSYVAKNLPAVHSQIIQWNKAGGKALAGLTRRRNREWAMIANGDYGPEGRQSVVTDEPGKPIANAAPQPSGAAAPPVHSSDNRGVARLQPWHDRMESILGLYEFAGKNDNPAVLAMAAQCGGSISRDYKHDDIPWCALTLSWVMITTGFLKAGQGSLAAIDFKGGGKLMQRLDGPCVGAVAVKPRTGGNHVFIVRGKTADGHLVGTGGNQSDMVCDSTFDPKVCVYGWPWGAALPEKVGMGTLPVVEVRAHVQRKFPALPSNNNRPDATDLHPANQNANPPADVLAGTGMLRRGDTGDEVKDAQQLLIASGYKLDGTGTFGPKTEAAVRDYQKRHPQLEVTGILDPATRKALARDASAKGKLTTTAKAAGTTGGSTGTADAVTGGHFPWEVYAVGVVATLLVVGYFAWKYRDEIRAMFTRKQT